MHDIADHDEIWAHTPNEDGQPHLLCDHLRETADLAAQFAAKFDAASLGRAEGLLHDIGKFNPAFQKYLHTPSSPSPGQSTEGGAVSCPA